MPFDRSVGNCRQLVEELCREFGTARVCLESLAFVPEGPQLAWKPAESISSHVRSLAQVWSLAQEASAQGPRPRASEARLSLVREKCASYLISHLFAPKTPVSNLNGSGD